MNTRKPNRALRFPRVVALIHLFVKCRLYVTPSGVFARFWMSLLSCCLQRTHKDRCPRWGRSEGPFRRGHTAAGFTPENRSSPATGGTGNDPKGCDVIREHETRRSQFLSQTR